MPMITDTAKLIMETDLEMLVKCHITPSGVRNPYGKWLPYPFHDDALWAEPVLQQYVYVHKTALAFLEATAQRQIGADFHEAFQSAFKSTRPGGRHSYLTQRANALFTDEVAFPVASHRLAETNHLMCKPPVSQGEVVSILRAVWNSRNDAIARGVTHAE